MLKRTSLSIGIFGGTFNPIHIGHLILANEVRIKLNLSQIIFIPSFIPPHKNIDLCSGSITPELDAQHRYNMLKIALRDNRFFTVSDIEILRRGKSYTIDTMNEIIQKYPAKNRYYLIVGDDLVKDFKKWKDFQKLRKLVKIVILARNKEKGKGTKLAGAIYFAHPVIEISSTELRQKMKKGVLANYWVPEAVMDYIDKNKLYL